MIPKQRRHGQTTGDDQRPRAGLEPDDELLRGVQAGEVGAFEEFFTRYSTSIFRTAYGLTGDRQLAEEILQDTFARAYEHRATLRRDVSPLPWLQRVALNICYSRLRPRGLRWEPISQAVVALLRDLSEGPTEHVERRELREIVRAGIAELPPKQQRVVALYYLHELSIDETAEQLGIRPGTVKSRLHYALRALRGHLEDDRRFGGAYPSAVRDEVNPDTKVRGA